MLGLDDKLQLLENESEDCLEDLEHDRVVSVWSMSLM